MSKQLPAVESLAAFLPRALSELAEEDHDVLTRCDIRGMTQEETPARSRVQRARRRLREHLTEACQVKFDMAGKVSGFVPRQSPK